MLTTFVVSEPEFTLKLDGITVRLLEVVDRFELSNFKFCALKKIQIFKRKFVGKNS